MSNNIRIEHGDQIYEAEKGITVEEFIEEFDIKSSNQIVAAKVDNKIQELTYFKQGL